MHSSCNASRLSFNTPQYGQWKLHRQRLPDLTLDSVAATAVLCHGGFSFCWFAPLPYHRTGEGVATSLNSSPTPYGTSPLRFGTEHAVGGSIGAKGNGRLQSNIFRVLVAGTLGLSPKLLHRSDLGEGVFEVRRRNASLDFPNGDDPFARVVGGRRVLVDRVHGTKVLLV